MQINKFSISVALNVLLAATILVLYFMCCGDAKSASSKQPKQIPTSTIIVYDINNHGNELKGANVVVEQIDPATGTKTKCFEDPTDDHGRADLNGCHNLKGEFEINVSSPNGKQKATVKLTSDAVSIGVLDIQI